MFKHIFLLKSHLSADRSSIRKQICSINQYKSANLVCRNLSLCQNAYSHTLGVNNANSSAYLHPTRGMKIKKATKAVYKAGTMDRIVTEEGENAKKDEVRKNEEITEKQVFLIDEKGEKVGTVPTHVALKRAQAADLDLVQIVSKSAKQDGQVICKIMSYALYKRGLQRAIKLRKVLHSKTKDVNFSNRIAENDVETKIRVISGLLEKGIVVRVGLHFGKYDVVDENFAKDIFDYFLSRLVEKAKPQYEGYVARDKKVSCTFVPVVSMAAIRKERYLKKEQEKLGGAAEESTIEQILEEIGTEEEEEELSEAAAVIDEQEQPSPLQVEEDVESGGQTRYRKPKRPKKRGDEEDQVEEDHSALDTNPINLEQMAKGAPKIYPHSSTKNPFPAKDAETLEEYRHLHEDADTPTIEHNVYEIPVPEEERQAEDQLMTPLPTEVKKPTPKSHYHPEEHPYRSKK